MNKCEQCEKPSDDLRICEKCEIEFCGDCQAVYNQFSQIDYDCCKDCAENSKLMYDD